MTPIQLSSGLNNLIDATNADSVGVQQSILVAQALNNDQLAEIRRLQAEYGVDINMQPNGDFLIRVAPDEHSSGYNVSVTPVYVPPVTSAQVAELIEVQTSLVSDHADVVDSYNEEARGINDRRRAALETTSGGGRVAVAARAEARREGLEPYVTRVYSSSPEIQRQADYDAVRDLAKVTGFTDSPLNRVAVVAASARTGFAVPAEVFDADPFFGGAGAGADIVDIVGPLYGGPGGRLSLIGIAHDTDWLLGFALGRGPLADLHAFYAEGLTPSGLHGLDFSALGVAQEKFDQLIIEQQLAPGLRHTENYDGPGHVPGWHITFRNNPL